MTLEEKLILEAKIYVAMSEIDHDLRMWHRRHYSPSLAAQRSMLEVPYRFRVTAQKTRRSMYAFNERMAVDIGLHRRLPS